MTQYTVIIEEGDASYGAHVPDLPGCVAVGDSREEVERLISEAVLLHLELLRKRGDRVPQPATSSLEIEVPS